MGDAIRIHRRRFLAGVAATTGAFALSGIPAPAKSQSNLPRPELSGIEHVVVVMMENRSFDHFLGWVPGADGKQAGLSYLDRSGTPQPTYRLAPDFQGCGHPDPAHSYEDGRVEYNHGACDGWLQTPQNDIYSIGYYTQQDLSFYGGAAPQWTTLDRYFAPIMADSFPNRIYQHAAQTDRIDNTFFISTLPTIWDRLAQNGLKGRYYFSDVPVLALWGAKYISISRPFAQFLFDCATNNLPHVAFVDPQFLQTETGTVNSDHPHADIRNGQAFVDLVYKAVTLSRGWSKTVLVVTYDEWGGFFDHVPPPTGPVPTADRLAGNADGLFGFRVPALLIAPSARRNSVSSISFDHTSILRMIEWRWGLQSLSVRDASANNLAAALDFNQRQRAPPQFAVPSGRFGSACASSAPSSRTELSDKWLMVKSMARSHGWPM